MSTKTLVSIGTTIALLALGTAIWAQQSPKPLTKQTQKNEKINVLLHNDYHVMQECRGVALLVGAKDQTLGETLQKQVEITLKRHRVPTLSIEAVQKVPNGCYLEIDVSVDNEGKTYYSRLAYSELVGLIRKTKTLGMMMPLYDDIKSGAYDADNTENVKKLVAGQVERFCVAFRKANPKG